MDYYKEVKKTTQNIDALAEIAKYTRKDIAFFILRANGFGDKFVNKYLNESIEINHLFEHKNGVISTKPEEA